MTKLYNKSLLKERRRKLRRDMPKGEKLLWSRLKANQLNYKFRRQYSLDKYILDFYCPKVRLNVEVDGLTHENKQKYDKERQKYIESKRIKVIRFRSDEVIYDLERVLQQINYVCDQLNNK